MENKMDKLEISVDLANKILGYLGTRPYQEVFHLITAIQDIAKDQLPPAEEEKKDE